MTPNVQTSKKMNIFKQRILSVCCKLTGSCCPFLVFKKADWPFKAKTRPCKAALHAFLINFDKLSLDSTQRTELDFMASLSVGHSVQAFPCSVPQHAGLSLYFTVFLTD